MKPPAAASSERLVAPIREVVRMLEVTGPRGGVHLVLVLECEHWITRRQPATRVPCIGCCVEEAMRRSS